MSWNLLHRDRTEADEEPRSEGHTENHTENHTADHTADHTDEHIGPFAATREEVVHQRYGGVNAGAAFFGWLVAIGLTVLLAGVLGAAAAAVGETADLTRDDLEGSSDLGLGAVVLLILVLTVGYYCGGYVAGRMSRFDGANQGFAVWLIGVAVTLVAVGAGALFGTQYDVQDRVDLPRVPFSDSELTIGGIVAGLVLLALTLLAAMLGGRVGHRYHDKVDRIVGHRGH